jgi:predicted nucleotide-binding protein
MDELVLQAIRECDLMICDVTEGTPNVQYAAGYALALHKKVIFIAERTRRVSVGTKGAVVLEYGTEEERASSFVYRLAHEIRRHVQRNSDVFFGYCSRADKVAARIRAHLESQGLSVLDWARDFRTGRTILEEVRRAATTCRCGLFLFTADDPLNGVSTPVAIPRDNVVLETGYFIGVHGPGRVVVVQETGTKMPGDLGGLIYLTMEDRAQWRAVADKVAKSLRQSMKSV